MKVQRLLTKTCRRLSKYAPTMLSVFGAFGVVGTSVLAIRATPKAIRIVEDRRIKEKDPPTKIQILDWTWQCYIPTILAGGTTISCILGANVLNKRHQASIASMYTMLDQSYKRYIQATKEVYGEDADERIKAQIAKSMYISCDGGYLYDPDNDIASDRVLYYDYQSSRYFESTVAAVINAQYHLNRHWSMTGEVSINTFYEFLGIDEIKGWDNLGWGFDLADQGFTWIDFTIRMTELGDGLECYVISPVIPPERLDEPF